MLTLNDHWIWDHWYLREGPTLHMFFLRASRALRDPERRHGRASIGHATSLDDGESWTLQEDALVHADSPAWDSRATWTGSAVLHPEGGIRLFYTGVSREEDRLHQRIGWAHARDGIHFERSGSEPLEPDPRWYETVEDSDWPEVAWRDPFVFLGKDGLWHMLITARANVGDPEVRGVIGHASSTNLDDWQVHPPLTSPGRFGHLEVPQQVSLDGAHWLVFSCGQDLSQHHDPNPARGGIWLAPGEGELGPWDLSAARWLEPVHYYAGQVVFDDDGRPLLGGFLNQVEGRFVGAAGDLVPLVLPDSR